MAMSSPTGRILRGGRFAMATPVLQARVRRPTAGLTPFRPRGHRPSAPPRLAWRGVTMDPDAAYVLRTVEERGVRFIRLWFVDVLGLLKSFAIPAGELESALEEGVELDGSALESFARASE